ncbi:hypothetical protein [Rhizobium sp. CG5]|uniref:hypothetical protein n=1 Tax=Rhizobium sp. CG5 TaxID=2726076 RepID=UPI0020338E58|nr:hypothetical protein [Rhizobium sp. CG5]
MNQISTRFGRRMQRVAWVAAVIAAATAAEGKAGPLADAAATAEQKAAAGDPLGAYDAAAQAFAAFAATLPFSVKTAVFVSDKPKAYGAYTPRKGSTFAPGEPLVTYVELIGLSWKDIGEGQQQSNFSVDLELKDKGGETLAAQKGFGSFSFTGFVANQEIYTHLTLDITGAEPGDYVLHYTINDNVGQKVTAFEQPFTVLK